MRCAVFCMGRFFNLCWHNAKFGFQVFNAVSCVCVLLQVYGKAALRFAFDVQSFATPAVVRCDFTGA